jgi:hypothetical protein
MAWTLSRFRAGDLVEVRSREDILATLDPRGTVDGMPFMPEMLQFCGRRFRVRAVAHKTCDTARQTWKARRLGATVHLADLRCDGSAHDGCQAECSLFWKDVWLKPAGEDTAGSAGRTPVASVPPLAVLTEADLLAQTRRTRDGEGREACYSCQATRLYDFTEPLSAWDLRQYVFDVTTGNRSASRALRVVWLGLLRWALPRVPFGYRLFKQFSDRMHGALTGRPTPCLDRRIGRDERTPTGRLGLRPGDVVRTKSQEEIAATLDGTGKNRGLFFDAEEMAPYCGQAFKVRSLVTKIIDEPTGVMIRMKQPCVMLEGVVCNADYAACRLNCPREIPSYWRELWLERVAEPSAVAGEDDQVFVKPSPGQPHGAGGAESTPRQDVRSVPQTAEPAPAS